MNRVALSGLIFWISAMPAIAQQKSQKLQPQPPPTTVVEAVKYCVELVHRLAPKEEFQGSFYKQFDAYYNPATEKVHNNAYRNGDTPPLYQFNKCMVETGFPLGPSKE